MNRARGAGQAPLLAALALACRPGVRGAQTPALRLLALTAHAPSPAPPTAPAAGAAPSPDARSSQAAATEQAAAPTALALPEAACRRPANDYAVRIVNGEIVSRRTFWMLERAKEIYPGPGGLLRVTQGSFREDVGASFGTHAGGGAVDISIRDSQTNASLFGETEAMARALLLAGFAAWYRAPGALGPNSQPHIHAVAAGERGLAPAAQEQLPGAHGYFDGMDGLAPPYGPNPDPHGGPVICLWMVP